MSDLIVALQSKISALEDEKEEMEESLRHIEIKLEICEELIAVETGTPVPTSKKNRGSTKRSRTKKNSTKNKEGKASTAPKDALWKEASGSLPDGAHATTKEEQQQAIRRFNPAPKPNDNYGVRAGDPADVLGIQTPETPGHVNVEVKD